MSKKARQAKRRQAKAIRRRQAERHGIRQPGTTAASRTIEAASKSVDVALPTTTVEIQAAEGDGDAPKIPTFEMDAYSGGLLKLQGRYYPMVVDLQGMEPPKQNLPVRLQHNSRDRLGHTTNVEIVNGERIEATGILSGTGQAARDVIGDARNGFPFQASIGALARNIEFIAPGSTVTVNGQTFTGPIEVARRSRLGELSIVDCGADETGATTRISAAAAAMETPMTFEQWLKQHGFDPQQINAQQSDFLKAQYDDEIEAADEGDEAGDGNGSGGGSQSANIAASGHPGNGNGQRQQDEPANAIVGIRAEAATEIERISEVRRIAADHPNIQAQAIRDGWTIEKTELETLRASRTAAPAVIGRTNGQNTEVQAQAMEAAIQISAGAQESEIRDEYSEQVLEAATSNEYRDFGLHSLLYATIQAAGMHARPGTVNRGIIETAMRADQQLIQAAASSGASTVSLSGILGNVANKRLLAGFRSVDSVVEQIAAVESNSNFLKHTRYRLTGHGTLEKVGADGTLKHARLGESEFESQVETFGKMITLTRQMLTNDDLNAFAGLPRVLGRMASLSREKEFFKLLLSNPNSFFSAGNKNWITGADSNLQISSLTEAVQKFRDQTDDAGEPIGIMPKILLVPTSLETPAQQLFSDAVVNETTTANKPKPAGNPHQRKFTPVSTPQLNAQGYSGSSSLAWYLFADPADVAAVEIAYLRGRRTPTTESSQADFNTLGWSWRAYWDFGVGMRDPQAAVKVKGES